MITRAIGLAKTVAGAVYARRQGLKMDVLATTAIIGLGVGPGVEYGWHWGASVSACLLTYWLSRRA